MYIAAGMHAVPADYADSPWHTLDPGGKVGFNTILLVGRDGAVVGEYCHPFNERPAALTDVRPS
jgi:hypothetical protein